RPRGRTVSMAILFQFTEGSAEKKRETNTPEPAVFPAASSSRRFAPVHSTFVRVPPPKPVAESSASVPSGRTDADEDSKTKSEEPVYSPWWAALTVQMKLTGAPCLKPGL